MIYVIYNKDLFNIIINYTKRCLDNRLWNIKYTKGTITINSVIPKDRCTKFVYTDKIESYNFKTPIFVIQNMKDFDDILYGHRCQFYKITLELAYNSDLLNII